MRLRTFRLTLGMLLIAMVPLAAYLALYAELRSFKTYSFCQYEIRLQPVGLAIALGYLAVSGLSIALFRGASWPELLVQVTATPCWGLMVFSIAVRRTAFPVGDGSVDLNGLFEAGIVSSFALAVVLVRW